MQVEVDALDGLAAANGEALAVETTWAPIRPKISRNASPGWEVSSGQPGTLTRPPATRAAARNGAAFDRSGSISTSIALIGPFATRQVAGSLSSTSTPR